MKFVELKKNLISGNIFATYNICGEDAFLIDSAKNLFFKYLTDGNELSRVMLSCDGLKPERLNTILSTSSFLTGRRVVYITDLNVTKNKDISNACIEYSKHPDELTTLVVISNEPILDAKKNNKILSNSNCKFCFVDCNRLDKHTMQMWIKSNLKEQNATMTDDAIEKLIDFSNGYLSKIAMELCKLESYASGKEIGVQDVELLVSKDLEYGVFELTECIGKKDVNRSLQIVESLMQESKTSQIVFAMISNYFRRMFYSAITPKTNLQIAGLLGVKEWAVAKAKQTATYFTKGTLKNIMELCAELDYDIRTGKISYKKAVDYLVFYILTSKK